MKEVRKLKSEGKISNEEFSRQIEESKERLDELIARSPITIETKKIVRARAAALYASFPKRPKRKTKEEKNKAKQDASE